MGHYKSNLRDIEFVLFEVLGRQDVLGRAPFEDVDEDTARTVLAEMDVLARTELAASFADADRNPPTLDTESAAIRLPESFRRSYRAYVEGGWLGLDLPAELGGTPMPPSVRWALAELVLGANPAVHMYASGASFAHIFWTLATPDQQRWAQVWADRGWGATMVLTEPEAGSDVGAGRTRAVPQPDGSWHLEGVKRFITSAEHDLSDNIIHLVLARPDGVPGAGGPGTKGLSLFLVPKFQVDWDTGRLGERNGVYVTALEHKMGLKVSTTCELRLGERAPAVGWLVGEVHDGIAQMFRVIESARMMVGTKAIATLSTGYLHARDYARARVQGADLTRMTDKTAPRVPITAHPDVRRSLLTQKAYAEGMRALVLYTASVQDAVAVSRAGGGTADADRALNDLLLPLVKGYGSERSYALLGGESLQTFGGSGYLEDYPIEQYVRDAKIDTLYEGTTAIQGLDLFFRKVVRDQGRALARLLSDISDFAKGDAGNGRLARERALLEQGVDDVQAVVGRMVADYAASAQDPPQIYKVGQNTTRLLLALGDLVVAWLLLRGAEVALDRLGTGGRDRLFYEGKLAAAQFFARTVLPLLTAVHAVAESVDNELMALPDAAF